MPDLIGWIIERRDRPGFIAGFRDRFVELVLEPRSIRSIGIPEPELPGNRLNDAKADREGRIWAGSMDDREREPSGHLYRLDPGFAWQRVHSGYRVANGPTFSPDGRTLYHSDSAERKVYRFDVAADGSLANKRAFVELTESDGFPDGMTTDIEGGVWVALWGGRSVRRFKGNGSFDRAIELPVSQVTSCVFAGARLDRMFITTASVGMEHEPLAGGLFEADPGVIGLPTNTFAG